MKKLDKLVLFSFIGPFLITFFVVVFILLTQFMLRYFDEIVGKDLGVAVISQLIFYFSINMTTNALPLAVLLSSLMTFGNLGEHFELTAIKGSGISLLRTMRPLFLVTCILVTIGFFNNNYIVPQANLEAFSLLYDIKQKKPALDIKQGVFYNGIPGYSIKINHKFDDDETLKDIIIYNHIGQRGNKEVILADSGKMYNIMDNRYLVLELFEGKSYSEQSPNNRRRINSKEEANPYLRSQFDQSKMVFSLSEFDLKRTRKDLFSSNRLMKNINQLKTDLDSMIQDYDKMYEEIEYNSAKFFTYHLKEVEEIAGTSQWIKKRQEEKDTLITPEKINFQEGRVEPKTEVLSSREEEGDTARESSLNILKLKKEASSKLQPADPGNEKMKTVRDRRKLETIREKDSIRNRGSVIKDSILALQNVAVQKEDTLELDTLAAVDSTVVADSAMALDSVQKAPLTGYDKLDSMLATERVKTPALGQALNHIRYVKGNLSSQNIQLDNLIKQIRKFEIEKYKKLSMAMTILAMFLIGAPLGAIIKRGGLGMPVLLSILFFVLFYVISMLGEKWARQGLMSPLLGVWLANMALFPVGFFFLKQARRDARLLDTDYYAVLWGRIKRKLKLA